MKDLSSLKSVISEPFMKIAHHHSAIVLFSILGFMIYVTYSFSQSITLPVDEIYRSEQQATKVKTRFDEVTIEKIDRLKARQENSPLSLPSGRINPFTE